MNFTEGDLGHIPIMDECHKTRTAGMGLLSKIPVD